MAVQDKTYTDVVIVSEAWDGRLAYAISQVGSPPVLTATAIVLNGSTLSSPRAWVWAGIHIFLAVLAPLLYLVWLVRRGWVTDLDVQLRQQRIKPMLFTVVCAGLAWLVLTLGAAPRQMVVLAGAGRACGCAAIPWPRPSPVRCWVSLFSCRLQGVSNCGTTAHPGHKRRWY
jgi:hypothetical protein